jgi:chaperonin GroES
MADFSCQLVSQAVWHGFSRKKNDLLRQARQKTYNNKKQYYIMNIKPLADRVLILPAPAEEKTIGGIIIPDTAKEKPLQGEVVAVGNGTKDEEMVLKAGDQVLYGKYSGTEIEHDGVKYLIMRQSDVLAVLN